MRRIEPELLDDLRNEIELLKMVGDGLGCVYGRAFNRVCRWTTPTSLSCTSFMRTSTTST
jgi:hypothetical protein